MGQNGLLEVYSKFQYLNKYAIIFYILEEGNYFTSSEGD